MGIPQALFSASTLKAHLHGAALCYRCLDRTISVNCIMLLWVCCLFRRLPWPLQHEMGSCCGQSRWRLAWLRNARCQYATALP